ncbi:MAG: hypothetical protein Q9159_006755 [Coniocarpon cinnabarinum]
MVVFPVLTASLLLPIAPGPQNVTVTTGPITDTSRQDPYAPSPTPRSLMLSIFQPGICLSLQPVTYVPNLTATVDTAAFATALGLSTNFSFADFDQQLCPYPQQISPPLITPGDQDNCKDTTIDEAAPLVLFSPGLGGPRQFYSQLAAAVSSYGYTVVSMDHTYEPPVVEFPDGTAIYANVTASNSTDPVLLNRTLDTRTADVSSVLDALSNPTTVASLLPTRGAKAFDTTRVAMFGHSFGGATTASAILNDPRLLGGINLDGQLFGPVIEAGLSRPFMLFTHGDQPIDGNATVSWNETFAHLRAFKLWLQLQGARHYAFSDVGEDLAAFGVDTSVDPYSQILGTINGQRAVDVVSRYVIAFLGMLFGGPEDPLFEGPSEIYPEVTFVRA